MGEAKHHVRGEGQVLLDPGRKKEGGVLKDYKLFNRTKDRGEAISFAVV